MDHLYSCLQGAFAGGIVGIALGPLSAWGLRFLRNKEWGRFWAILIGGTLGDGSLAAVLLLGTSASVEVFPFIRAMEHPLFAGSVFVVTGVIGLKMAAQCGPYASATNERWSFDRFGTRSIFWLSFTWNFVNADTFAAFPLGVAAAGIGTIEENVARLAGFVPAAFVGTIATIVGFELLARVAHSETLPWLVRILSIASIACGMYAYGRYVHALL